jgi:hypothetical protein
MVIIIENYLSFVLNFAINNLTLSFNFEKELIMVPLKLKI